MSIGERVYELRHDLGLTMVELGDKIGVGKATIKKYESGDIKNIPSDKIESLAEALETTPEYLMGWTESSTVQKNQISENSGAPRTFDPRHSHQIKDRRKRPFLL